MKKDNKNTFHIQKNRIFTGIIIDAKRSFSVFVTGMQ